jgi:hypothetical protein
MTYVRITDLDELVLTVRDRTSRSYITEAISAYRGGAYRSSIVSVWIAVACDIISKLRELGSQGDPNAMSLVTQLDKYIADRSIAQLQVFEERLLDRAYKEFEFLATHEYEDLCRLKADRNLCAHPAFVADEALFQPTPELVRTHIVHAVIHLLQHQPVQGKSALDRIKADMLQLSFPDDVEGVTTFLGGKYLNRAKDALVKNFLIVLLKNLLRGDDPDLAGKDQELLHSLIAVSRIHPVLYEQVVSSRLPDIVDALDDNQLINVFHLLRADVRIWTWISEAARIRLRRIVQRVVKNNAFYFARKNKMFDALVIDEFRATILRLFDDLEPAEKQNIIQTNPHPAFAEKAVELYSSALSFRQAEALAKSVILPMAPFFTTAHIIKILGAVRENDQIRYASGSPGIIEQFFEKTKHHLPDTRKAWRELGVFLQQVDDEDDYYTYPGLQAKLRSHGIL